MVPKILWVVLPLSLYALWLAVATWRGRAPPRLALNVHTSVLLLCYLLTTAGLGVFWVANQQLPVFDWHYLFGYATLLLVSVHLMFNLPLVLNWLRRKRPPPAAPQRGGAYALGRAAAIIAALGAAFFLGSRQGASDMPALHWRDAPAAAGAQADGATAAVVRYHEFSSESRGSVFRRAPGVEWGAAPSAFKAYPEAPKIALGTAAAATQALGDALRGPAQRAVRHAGSRLRLAELGQMLHLSSGVTERRGGHALRAAPSSGALFPSELYVLARAVDGLAPGLYHYDPEHHRLDALGPAPAATAATGAPQADGADAVVILSAVFRRTGYKYHNRAYRYAAADAGHLLENLRLASHQAGMRATLLTRFDEAQAARMLGIDGVEEGVLAMMDLRPAAQAAPVEAAATTANGATPAQPRFVAAPAPGSTAVGVTGAVQQATSLRLAAQPVPLLAPAPATGASDAQIVALPPPVAASLDVHRSIVQRRSQRRFLAEPVPLAALSSLLADMAQAPQLSDAIRVHLVVNRVAGLAPGVYRYLSQHALTRVAAGDFAAAARQAALAQDVIGDAAVVLVLTAERGPALAAGARGYRHAFLEAGMLGERWLLGAVARGLAACPVGAFYDDEAAALIGVDPQRQWVLHFAALGLAAR